MARRLDIAAKKQDARLAAENAMLDERVRRVGSALLGVIDDLARTERENAALQQENRRLRATLAGPRSTAVRSQGPSLQT